MAAATAVPVQNLTRKAAVVVVGGTTFDDTSRSGGSSDPYELETTL